MAKTTAQKKRDLGLLIERQVRKWQPRLGLNQWSIEVNEYPNEAAADKDTALSIDWSPSYMTATLAFFPQTLVNSRKWVEHTVVHEMLHLQFARLTDLVEENFHMKSPLGIELHARIETALDGLATIIQKEFGK